MGLVTRLVEQNVLLAIGKIAAGRSVTQPIGKTTSMAIVPAKTGTSVSTNMSDLAGYHLVMTNSSPWKITMLLSSVNHLFLWAIYIYHGYVSHNQRVYPYLSLLAVTDRPCRDDPAMGGI